MLREPFRLILNRVLSEDTLSSCLGVMVSKDLRQSFVTIENKRYLIPDGEYTIIFTNSPRFSKRYPYSAYMNGKVPLILVPNHDGIRIHIANYGYELTGCIGIGRTMNFNFAGESRVAYIELMKAIEKYDYTCDKGVIEIHTLNTCDDLEFLPL